MARQPKPLTELTPKYARRIAKALSEGKTRQEGRGKAPGAEYAQRKAASERKAAGLPRLPPRRAGAVPAPPPSKRAAPAGAPLTPNQRAAVRRFADAQLPRKYGKNASAAQKKAWRTEVARWAEGIGWARFQEFRVVHRMAELQTRQEVRAGTYDRRSGRGGYETTILDDWMEDFDLPDPDLGFYH